MYRWCHCEIASTAEIGPGFVIRHQGAIVINGKVRIGANCEIHQGVTLGGNQWRAADDGRTNPILEDNVSVGPGAMVLGPVIVGAGTLIGANAVVVTDIPPNSVAAGVPARVIRRDGKKMPLLERGGELAGIVAGILRRLSSLETRVAQLTRN